MNKRELTQAIVSAIETEAACHLDCDGYLITAKLVRVSHYKLQVAVYVDNYIRGTDMEFADDIEHLGEKARRFMRHGRVYAWTPAQVARAQKALGKREAKRMGFSRDNFSISTSPFFRTALAAARHLVKFNPSIQVLTREQHGERLRAKERAAA